MDTGAEGVVLKIRGNIRKIKDRILSRKQLNYNLPEFFQENLRR